MSRNSVVQDADEKKSIQSRINQMAHISFPDKRHHTVYGSVVINQGSSQHHHLLANMADSKKFPQILATFAG